MVSCNTTLEDSYISEEPLYGNFTFHHLGLFLGAVFGLVSVVISFYLIAQHARHYSRPWEQRHIIRIIFMIPVYAVVSFLSFYYYRKAIYFEAIRDCYEAFAISSFFTLLCHYVAPDLHEQKAYFRTVTPVNWFWGVFGAQKCTGGENKGPFRRPRSGLTWFNVIWVGIFQYCFIRVLFTIVSVATEPFGRYCAASYSPAFAHIWTVAFECLSVTVAMFMVVQFYIQLKTDLKQHKPGIKVLSIKLVIFFSFWQTMVISFLASANGPLQPTKKLAYQDIKIGIPSVILIIEMSLFSVLHIFAYPWKPYDLAKRSPDSLGAGYSTETPKYQGGPFGIKALADAFNPWDIIKASARGFRWMFVGVKHRHNDPSYQPAKMGADNTGYMGPTYAMSGDAATEAIPNSNRRGRTAAASPEDDTAGLLHEAQEPARVPEASPYRPVVDDEWAAGDDSNLDLGAPRHPAQAASPWAAGDGIDWKPSEYDDDPVGFHPGMGPPPGSALPTGTSGEVHPAYRGQTPNVPAGQGWNHWGGVESSQWPKNHDGHV